MKKILFVIFILMMIGFGFIEKSDDSFLNKFLHLDFNYIVSYSSSVEDDNLIDVGFIKIGNYKSDNLKDLNKSNSKYITSETIILNNISVDQVLSLFDAKVLDSYNIDNILVLNCYTSKLSKVCYVSNKKFNLQIAINENEIKVGYPTIAEGF